MPAYFRADPRERPREFEHAINRRIGSRSASLRRAVDAFDRYIRHPGETRFRQVVRSIEGWRASSPREWRTRCLPIWPTLLGQMRTEARKYSERVQCLADCVDETPTTLAAALTWVNAVNTPAGLGDFSTYACLDATTFYRSINGDQTPTGPVRTRETAWNAGAHRPYGTNPALALFLSRRWDAARLQRIYTQISGAGGRGAVCTSFAWLAAHVLTNGRPNGPRVEVVSYPNGRRSHVYVLVGRRGLMTDGDRIPDDWDAVVVDAWAAALGHACVFANRAAFRFGGMTTNLELKMIRPQS